MRQAQKGSASDMNITDGSGRDDIGRSTSGQRCDPCPESFRLYRKRDRKSIACVPQTELRKMCILPRGTSAVTVYAERDDRGKRKSGILDLTKEIGEAMTYSTPCTMGQVSSKIALSAVEKFESEFTAHIKKKKCPAGVCFSEEVIYIDPKLCQGCGECADVCPKDCIEGKAKIIHMIMNLTCDQCGKCIESLRMRGRSSRHRAKYRNCRTV